MPTDRHLEVIEIKDFAPGLWTRGGGFLMPAEGWQQMDDCRPEQGGGLRAAAKPTAIPTTGITNLSTSSCLALISFGGQGTSGADDRYLWTKDTTSNLVRVWRMVNDTSWTAVTTVAYDPNDPGPYIQVDTFTKSSGTQYVLWTLWQNGAQTTVEGFYEIDRSTGLSAGRTFTVVPTALCVMDDIVVVAEGPTLYFTTSGTTTFDTAARFLDVQASRWESLINALVYQAPSDLLCGTNSTVWSLVQGDLATSPVIRSMSAAHTVNFIQNLDQSDMGIPFYEAGTGIVLTSSGEEFNVLSEQLEPTDFTTGDISYQKTTLIAPNGFAWDSRTSSWYRQTDISSSLFHYNARRDSRIFVATSGNNFSIYSYDPREATRHDAYTVKTCPLRNEDGRRIKIRQVQVICNAWHTGDTLTVTVNGTARVSDPLTAGRNVVPFLFSEEAEMLDVTVTATANSASNEAPAIEAIRIGKARSHRSR